MPIQLQDRQDIAATIVTFNPDIGLLHKVFASVVKQVSQIYVIDNGSRNVEKIRNICLSDNVTFIGLERNEGIAAAFNIAFKKAENDGKEWLLTCDQDSIIPNNFIQSLTANIINHNENLNLAIICPNFFNRTTGVREYEGNTSRIINECISSGSLTRVKAWNQVGGFDEAMFIDGVDFEFCRRLRASGYDILLVPDVCLNHEIGNAQMYNLFGVKFLVLNHSSFRKYYIAQNIIYMDGKFNNGKFHIKSILKIIKQYLLVLFFEKKKIDKMNAISKGSIRGYIMCKNLRGH